MTREQFAALKPGDLVRHKLSAEAQVVMAHYGTRVTAARAVDITNQAEWDVVSPQVKVEDIERLVRLHFGPDSITSGGAVSTPAGRAFAENVVAIIEGRPVRWGNVRIT